MFSNQAPQSQPAWQAWQRLPTDVPGLNTPYIALLVAIARHSISGNPAIFHGWPTSKENERKAPCPNHPHTLDPRTPRLALSHFAAAVRKRDSRRGAVAASPASDICSFGTVVFRASAHLDDLEANQWQIIPEQHPGFGFRLCLRRRRHRRFLPRRIAHHVALLQATDASGNELFARGRATIGTPASWVASVACCRAHAFFQPAQVADLPHFFATERFRKVNREFFASWGVELNNRVRLWSRWNACHSGSQFLRGSASSPIFERLLPA